MDSTHEINIDRHNSFYKIIFLCRIVHHRRKNDYPFGYVANQIRFNYWKSKIIEVLGKLITDFKYLVFCKKHQQCENTKHKLKSYGEQETHNQVDFLSLFCGGQFNVYFSGQIT